MQTGDNTPQQTQTATIPWVEVGSAENAQKTHGNTLPCIFLSYILVFYEKSKG